MTRRDKVPEWITDLMLYPLMLLQLLSSRKQLAVVADRTSQG